MNVTTTKKAVLPSSDEAPPVPVDVKNVKISQYLIKHQTTTKYGGIEVRVWFRHS
jgi:hypothetical protein